MTWATGSTCDMMLSSRGSRLPRLQQGAFPDDLIENLRTIQPCGLPRDSG
jgi:hypothetical protein